MDFGFSEDQELLRATTRRFLAEHQPLSAVRTVMESPDPFDAAVWRRGAALGWTAMLVPPEHGGGSVSDQPLVDLIVLAEELGRELNPGPFVPCNVVADAIVRFGTEAQAKELLPRLAAGDATAGWCLSGDGTPEPDAVAVTAVRDGGRGGGAAGWRLDGVARYVQGGTAASALLVAARLEDGGFVHVLVPQPSAGLTARTLNALDLTRRYAELTFDGVQLPAEAALDGGWEIAARGVAVATVLQSGEAVGAAEALFESTVAYAKQRVQFGRTIGSFQAIKHRLANLQVKLEGMRVAAEYAALALGDELDDAADAVATAGAYVDDTFAHLCGEAVQLHGGVGFTWEQNVHLYVRRAKVNQVLYGDGSWHREQLVRLTEAAVDQGGLG